MMEYRYFNHNRIELLAPAGGMEQLTAAVENGADAVYLGGKLHNARAKAGNFDIDELKTACAYCHVRGVKVYATLNTLVAGHEKMEDILKYAVKLKNAGADALIIQDLGLGNEIRENIPGIELHLSTQATVYNSSGVKFASELGYKRVVLARECSLSDIRRIKEETEDAELEIFVHGALCFCCSGQCQLSRYIGGRSGNRGTCAQPCRLEYRLDGKKGYHLSPKDICTVDMIGELIEAGVSSLKIEGRLKSPEYVAAAVGIYRKYIDRYYDCRRPVSLEKNDRNILMQIFNRGGFTSGYLAGDPGRKLMTEDVPKHRGVSVGKVTGYDGKQIVTVEEKTEIHLGDGIEIHLDNGELAGNVVTFCERKKKRDGRTSARIGDIRCRDKRRINIKTGDPVFRIVSSELNGKLCDTYREGGPFGKKHRARVPVFFKFTAETEKAPVLYAEITDGRDDKICSEVTSEYISVPAEKKGTTAEMIRTQLSKLGSTPFFTSNENISIDIDDDLMIPVSVINSLRREAVKGLEKAAERENDHIEITMGSDPADYEENKRCAVYYHTYEGYINDKDVISENHKKAKKGGKELLIFVPVYDWFTDPDVFHVEGGCRVVPYLHNMTLGREDEFVKKNFDAVVQKALQTSGAVMVNNPGWLMEFSRTDLNIFAGPGLNVSNRYTAKLLMEKGVLGILPSYENAGPENGEILLMVTEHEIEGKVLEDRKNVKYDVVDHRIEDEHSKSLLISPDKRYIVPEAKFSWEIPCLYRK